MTEPSREYHRRNALAHPECYDLKGAWENHGPGSGCPYCDAGPVAWERQRVEELDERAAAILDGSAKSWPRMEPHPLALRSDPYLEPVPDGWPAYPGDRVIWFLAGLVLGAAAGVVILYLALHWR